MDKALLEHLLNRPAQGHKYTFGHTLIVGGSPGMVGAPLLSGKAALRTGAGLVTIASEDAVIDKLENRVEEIMTLSMPKASGEANALLQNFIAERKVTVMVLGPGLRSSVQLGNLVEKLVEQQSIPIIIDGGALGVLRDHPEVVSRAPSRAIILTPHVGEFKRLVNIELPEEHTELKPITKQFAEAANVHLVLKGHPTYVAHPDGNIYENTTGNPGLGTAGTGDVLTGVIAGIISQGVAVEQAIELAVYLHGLAGDIAAEEKTQPGMIASDVIEAIPSAYQRSKS
jgi:ADP-dependent NAD(P)H-hydrate dehydratase / NAD(P)H-hydrate epimerase